MSHSARRQRFVLGDGVSVDLKKLVVSRLIIQANSGGGKSRMIRRLLEQTHGRIQHIVLDIEGEFTSLLKKFDYIVAAKGGDTPCDPRAAPLLAERLLELKCSAICDLYELRPDARIEFVKLFLDALIDAPKHLWHPVLVIIDEAHVFCPQVDKAASSEAVKNLLTRGRKRGFCAVLATQRLSKLHKDAAAECINKLIGRSSLDIDVKRASDELGFASSEKRRTLMSLKPGEFYAFGPALTDTVTLFRGGEVVTKHPKAGSTVLGSLRASRKVRALLPKLVDIPAEQEQREQTKRQMLTEIADLKRQNRAYEQSVKALQPTTIPVFDKKQAGRVTRVIRRIEMTGVPRLNLTAHRLGTHLARFNEVMENVRSIVAAAGSTGPTPALQRRTTPIPLDLPHVGPDTAEGRVLAAIAQVPGSTPKKIGAMAGISVTKSTWRLALSKLRKLDLITRARDVLQPTLTGSAVAGSLPELPTGAAAVDYWRRKLGHGLPLKMFNIVLAKNGAAVTATDMQVEGIDPMKSTFRLAVSKLRKLDLIIGDRHGFYPNKELIGYGSHEHRMVRPKH